MTAPASVILARLEHSLEYVRLALANDPPRVDAASAYLDRALEHAKQLRDAL